MSRQFLLIALVTLCLGGPALADGFAGTYSGVSSDGQSVLQLTQSGTRVSGSLTVGATRLQVTGVITRGRVEGKALLDGTPVALLLVLTIEGDHLVGALTDLTDDGQPDPESSETIVFKRSTPAPVATAGLDRGDLDAIAGRVKKNFKPEGGTKVLAAGKPPLTRDSIASFAEVLRLTFGVELSESEYDDTTAVFVAYYKGGDAQTKTMLATGWQMILAELRKATGPARQTAIAEVRTVLEQRFEAGAQAGIPWAATMNATIQKRTSTVAAIKGAVPESASKAELHQQMSQADLDASLEMLYFMWIASGRDASLVTPESTAAVRAAIVANFATFPQQVQLIFANGQKVYSFLRGQWAQATQAQRVQMAKQFAASLDQLGLTVPSRGGGDRISADGAWSDMNGKSRGEWAGEMVQGLAGSSYHSSW